MPLVEVTGVARSSALAAKCSTAHASLGDTAACSRPMAAHAAWIFLSNGIEDASQQTSRPSAGGLSAFAAGACAPGATPKGSSPDYCW